MKVNQPLIRIVTLTPEEEFVLENAADILEELNGLVRAQEVVKVGDEYYSEDFITNCVNFILDIVDHINGEIIIHPEAKEEKE